MKKILLPLILLCIFSAICFTQISAYDVDVKNEKKELKYTQKRSVETFHSIRVSSVFNVYVKQDNSPALEIKATHDLLDKVITRVENGELVIEMQNDDKKEKRGWRDQLYSDLQINVYVSCGMLNAIRASGATDVYSVGVLVADDMKLTASGSSDIKLALEVKNSLTCMASGSSDIVLSGSVPFAEIKASGASDIDTKKMIVKSVKAVASGSSDLYLNVSESLDVNASGSSDVYYTGNPVTTNINSSGSSDVRRK